MPRIYHKVQTRSITRAAENLYETPPKQKTKAINYSP